MFRIVIARSVSDEAIFCLISPRNKGGKNEMIRGTKDFGAPSQRPDHSVLSLTTVGRKNM
jgi:hypothetical protein